MDISPQLSPKLSDNEEEQQQDEKIFPKISTKLKIIPRKLNNKIANKLPRLSKSGGHQKNNSRVYKYKIFPGNNSRVLLQILKKRPWWHAILGPEEDLTTVKPDFIWEMNRNSKRYKEKFYETVMLNHLQMNDCLVTKKGLYYCLKSYCERNGLDPLKLIPRTFFLVSGASREKNSSKVVDDDLQEFTEVNLHRLHTLFENSNNDKQDEVKHKTKDDVIWILKPACRTNRGFGIKVVQGFDAVMQVVNQPSSRKGRKDKNKDKDKKQSSADLPDNNKDNNNNNNNNISNTEKLADQAKKIASQDGWIIQLYMDRPLLVRGRKFDIRCFVLTTHSQRRGLTAYFFRDAYVRTSSKKYSLGRLADRETHLTNDAVQKHSKAYGKFEEGNKLDLNEWQKTIDSDYPTAPPNIVFDKIYPEIKRLSKLSVLAASEVLAESAIQKSFELFGYDYMVDEKFDPYLIEINTNPCLEFACPLLTTLITELIDNTIRVAVDTEFPPPSVGYRTKACEEAIELIEREDIKFEKFYP